ncbi:MAG: GLUG motif-containing protein, partial [Candidatus Nanoarchaeia archaeon]|nr:GLUG motif-containing protein [Candidatus Nanoarchaeia archaeon]
MRTVKNKGREKRFKKDRLINKKLIVPFAVLIFIAIILVFFKPSFIGFVTFGTESYTQQINERFDENESYNLYLEEYGELSSLRLSGSVIGDGYAKVYLETENKSYLVYDSGSSSKEGVPAITGLAVGDFGLDEVDDDFNYSVELNETEEINESETVNENPEVNETLQINETDELDDTYDDEIIEDIISPPEDVEISVILNYNPATEFDDDDNGIETIDGIVDFKVDAEFNWNADYNKLCTLWEVYSADDESSARVCYGNDDCCALNNLESLSNKWNDAFHVYIGRYGATENNVINCKVVYADYSLEKDNLYSYVYSSEWESLNAMFVDDDAYKFENECVETCSINLDESYYVLRVELYDAVLVVDSVDYSVIRERENHAPVQIKNISDIVVYKDYYSEIDLNEYFYDEDNDILYYSFYDVDNIDIFVENGIAKITPEKGFVGKKYTFVTVNDSEEKVISNVFAIDVVEGEPADEEIDEKNITETPKQLSAEINKPVKWVRKVVAENNESTVKSVNVSFDVHENAFNINVKDVKLNKKIEKNKIVEKEKTGGEFKAASVETDESKEKKIEFEDMLDVNETKEYIIEYETEAPVAFEIEVGLNKKQVVVSSEIHYENVLAYTEIPLEANEERIKLYWLVDGSRQLVNDASYIDTNNNGLIDKIKWIVPSLSNQTYEIIIEISKAEHLDENYDFISDIYDDVKALDNIWSEPIYHNDYVRIVFESYLDSSRDITVYARNNQSLNTTIEVYYYNSTEKITEFSVVDEEKYYKVYLTGMTGSHDTFDLKVKNLNNDEDAYLEFDYIVDPYPEIDVGNEAIDREWSDSSDVTIIDINNPANGTGKITSVEIWAGTQITGCQVATFYNVSENHFSTRDYETVNNGNGEGVVLAGSKQIFEVDLDVEEGDYIGVYWNEGTIDYDAWDGSDGIWYKSSDNIPCTNAEFTENLERTISLYATGIKYPSSSILIENCTQLQNMSNDLTADYILVEDIDCSDTITWNGGQGFVPVGNDSQSFSGTLDGQGYKITGLYINRPSSDEQGLFGITAAGATITDVGIEDANITGNDYVGGLVGFIWVGDEISNCYFIGNVTGNDYVGGLLGENDGLCVVNNSYAIANVDGNYTVGGLIGTNRGNVTNCYFIGNVSGDSYGVGGLIGSHYNAPILSDSYAVANVTGSSDGNTGGLVGFSRGNIANCHSNSTVNGGSGNYVGGLVGWSRYHSGTGEDADISNCYFIGSVTGSGQRLGGLVGSLDKSIFDSYAIANVTSSNSSVGGLLGDNSQGSVYNSYAIANVNGTRYVGGLVGYDNDGIINGSYAIANVTGTSDYVGGFAGFIDGNTSYCYSIANVTGLGSYVGGFVGGQTSDGNISDCYSLSNVEGLGDDYAGGFVGQANGFISDCYFIGNVTGTEQVGGFVGRTWTGTAYKTISRSYAIANVTGTSGYVGGFVGRNDHYIITNCYSQGNVYNDSGSGYRHGGFVGSNNNASINTSYSTSYVQSTHSDSGGFSGGYSAGYSDKNNFWDNETSGKSTTKGNATDSATGKTTAMMKSITTFNDTSTVGLDQAWDIVLYEDYEGETWYIDDGDDYPRLRCGPSNFLPKQTAPVISSSSGTNSTNENITCYAQGFSDYNGDDTTAIYNWYKDGKPIAVLNMPFDTDLTNASVSNSIKDYSGYGNDGTGGAGDPSKTPTWTSDGKVGGAYEFDGVDDYIRIPDDPSTEGMNELTINVWINGNQLDQYEIIVAKGCGSWVGYSIFGGGSNTISFYARNSTGNAISSSFQTTSAISTNQWYMITLVLNGTHGIWYINGSSDNSFETEYLDSISTSYDYLCMSTDADYGEAKPFNGTIDEVKIYNYSLSADQIWQNYIDSNASHTDNRTIVSDETDADDVWTCEVTPNDATDDGTALNSSDLTILSNAVPTHTTPLISSSSGTNSIYENITCYVQDLSDADGDNTTAIYNWYKDGEPIAVLN